MPPSNERTERLQSIFDKMCSLTMASFPLLPELATSPSPGDKLAALSILQYFADAEYLPFLVRVIEKEKSFVGYHAAKALEFAVSTLDSIYIGEVSLAIEEAIIGLEKSDPEFDSDRLKILRRAKHLGRRESRSCGRLNKVRLNPPPVPKIVNAFAAQH